ncbi:hypothetical protein [Actinopolyspora lacussalsi]
MIALVLCAFSALLNFTVLLVFLREVPDVNYWIPVSNLIGVLLFGPLAVLNTFLYLRARWQE